MQKVLLLSSNAQISGKIHLYLDKFSYKVDNITHDIHMAYPYIYKTTYDIIIIHDSYLNGYYALIDKLVATSRWPIIYISNKYNTGQLFNAVNDIRFHMIDEFKIPNIKDILDIYSKLVSRINVLEKENKKLIEQKAVDTLMRKAKLKLMDELGLSENDAHAYIVKKAMTDRLSKGEVAKNIISK